MANNLLTVRTWGFPLDDFTFTYRLSGTPTEADAGKAVTLDTTQAGTMKLTGDNDVIMGRLFSVEVRTVDGIRTGAVQRKFKEKLPAATGHGIVLGDTVVGSATPGVVKKGATQTEPKFNRVVEVGTDFVVVEYL